MNRQPSRAAHPTSSMALQPVSGFTLLLRLSHFESVDSGPAYIHPNTSQVADQDGVADPAGLETQD